MKEAIWRRRPVLGEIMEKHGNKTLHSYAKDFIDVNKSPLLDARKDELIETARELLETRLGKDAAEKFAKQLKKLPLVSTADHHSPIDHPFWVNANIISALPYLDLNDPDIHYLPVFSFASVSVNNASGFARGILFHGGVNGSGNLIRLPILPDRCKMGVVYSMRPFTREDLTKTEAELAKKEKIGEIAPGRGEEIRKILETYFARPDVLAESDLASQITTINFHLWQKLFTPSERKIPDLIYLEIETLVRELLLRFHLPNPASLIHRLLFDTQHRERIRTLFNNLAGGFSLNKGWGTYMFWAMDEKLHRVQLQLEDGKLVSDDKTVSIDFTPEGVAQALRERKIFPAMLLCYILVSLYYGMKCLGGFCQVHDLTVIKEAWMNFLKEIGEGAEAGAVESVQTRELGGDGMVLSYLKTVKGDLVPATGIDMALEDLDTKVENYMELSKKVTLAEMMNPMILEMYTVLYSAPDRDPKFLALSPEMIIRATGLQEKLEDAL